MFLTKRTYVVKDASGGPIIGRNGKPVKARCSEWTIQWRDAAGRIKRQSSGCTDKLAAAEKMRSLQIALERGEVGRIDEYKASKARPLAEHVNEYIDDLRNAGRDPMYVYNIGKRLDILANECGWKSLPQIEPNSFMAWRQRQKTSPRKANGRLGETASATTLNQYLETVRAFVNWCVKSKRIAGNALASIDRVEGETIRKRRALSDADVAALLAKCDPAHKLVYRFALSTGLRRDELEQLQWRDLGLRAIKPYIQLRAEATKARRADRLPLQDTLAEDLRAIRGDAKDTGRVFDHVPPIGEWKSDLHAAGIPYKDEQGRQVDFHAGTRKTLCTRMNRAGVPLAVAMRLMRHTDARLTLVDYIDDEQVGVADAMAKLPEIQAATPAAIPAVAAG